MASLIRWTSVTTLEMLSTLTLLSFEKEPSATSLRSGTNKYPPSFWWWGFFGPGLCFWHIEVGRGSVLIPLSSSECLTPLPSASHGPLLICCHMAIISRRKDKVQLPVLPPFKYPSCLLTSFQTNHLALSSLPRPTGSSITCICLGSSPKQPSGLVKWRWDCDWSGPLFGMSVIRESYHWEPQQLPPPPPPRSDGDGNAKSWISTKHQTAALGGPPF